MSWAWVCVPRDHGVFVGVFFGLAILAVHPGSGLGLLSSCVLFCACPLLAGVCVRVGVCVSGRPVYRHGEAW